MDQISNSVTFEFALEMIKEGTEAYRKEHQKILFVNMKSVGEEYRSCLGNWVRIFMPLCLTK